MHRRILPVLVGVLILATTAGESAAVALFYLNSNGDASDANPGDGVCGTGAFIGPDPECTLRAIIEEANALPGVDFANVRSSIATDANGFVQIAPLSALPSIAETLWLDFHNAPGYDSADPFATPIVQLDGSQVGAATGLAVVGAAATTTRISALAIHGFTFSALYLAAPFAIVQGCHIGVADGQVASGNGNSAILVADDDARIGQAFSAVNGWIEKGNVISGNLGVGLNLSGDDALVAGNRIGTDPSGTIAMGNAAFGVLISGDRTALGSVETLNAGGDVASGNLISANSIGISVYPAASDTIIEANHIGTDVTGTLGLGNAYLGVQVRASDIDVGSTGLGGNLISGNLGTGVFVSNATSLSGITIEGNRIGVTADSSAVLPNSGYGIESSLAQVNVRDNVISGNVTGGVRNQLAEALFFANHIGTNANGDDLGNSGHGILNLQAPTLVVDSTEGRGNVIAFNALDGIHIDTCGACQISDNTIGSALPGENAGNGGDGLYIGDANLGDVFTNRIGENGGNGVTIEGGTASGSNPIWGNEMFGNAGIGIDLGGDGATPNDVGDGDVGENDLQNFPVFDPDFTTYNAGLGQIEVRYRVDSNLGDASYPLRIDFYLADADGEEGAFWIGFDSYPAVSAGAFRSFAFTPPGGIVYEDEWILATAMDGNFDTSEFGAPVPLPEPGGPLVLAAGSLLLAVLARRRRA